MNIQVSVIDIGLRKARYQFQDFFQLLIGTSQVFNLVNFTVRFGY